LQTPVIIATGETLIILPTAKIDFSNSAPHSGAGIVDTTYGGTSLPAKISEIKVNCVICQHISKTDETAEHYVYETEHWHLRHANETDIEGYLILEPRRHILDFADANEEELATYGTVIASAMRAIKKVVAPVRIYTFTLAESCPHLHVHLIPRSEDFPEAWRARGIMSYPLSPVVNPTRMPELCASFRNELQRQIPVA